MNFYIGESNRKEYDLESLKNAKAEQKAKYYGLSELVSQIEKFDRKKELKDKIEKMGLSIGDKIYVRYTGGEKREAVITNITQYLEVKQRLSGNRGWYKSYTDMNPSFIEPADFEANDLPKDVIKRIKNNTKK